MNLNEKRIDSLNWPLITQITTEDKMASFYPIVKEYKLPKQSHSFSFVSEKVDVGLDPSKRQIKNKQNQDRVTDRKNKVEKEG